jgi:hypothetical protein
LNEAGDLRVIVERPAKLADGRGQDGLADRGLWPPRLEQRLLGHEPIGLAHQPAEHGERPAAKWDVLVAAPEPFVQHVETEGPEQETACLHTRSGGRPSGFQNLLRTGSGLQPQAPDSLPT